MERLKILCWELGVCSSQGLGFDSPRSRLWWASPYRALLSLWMGTPQVDGEIGPFELVGPWARYQVFEREEKHLTTF